LQVTLDRSGEIAKPLPVVGNYLIIKITAAFIRGKGRCGIGRYEKKETP
jgi:hypothetical protein